MARRSIEASEIGIKLARNTLISKKLKQQDLVRDVCYSRQLIAKFSNEKTFKSEIFVKICERLVLNWQEIADLPESDRLHRRVGIAHLTNELFASDCRLKLKFQSHRKSRLK